MPMVCQLCLRHLNSAGWCSLSITFAHVLSSWTVACQYMTPWHDGQNINAIGPPFLRFWWQSVDCSMMIGMLMFPSVLWHCWPGDRKGIRTIKNSCHLSHSFCSGTSIGRKLNLMGLPAHPGSSGKCLLKQVVVVIQSGRVKKVWLADRHRAQVPIVSNVMAWLSAWKLQYRFWWPTSALQIYVPRIDLYWVMFTRWWNKWVIHCLSRWKFRTQWWPVTWVMCTICCIRISCMRQHCW